MERLIAKLGKPPVAVRRALHDYAWVLPQPKRLHKGERVALRHEIAKWFKKKGVSTTSLKHIDAAAYLVYISEFKGSDRVVWGDSNESLLTAPATAKSHQPY